MSNYYAESSVPKERSQISGRLTLSTPADLIEAHVLPVFDSIQANIHVAEPDGQGTGALKSPIGPTRHSPELRSARSSHGRFPTTRPRLNWFAAERFHVASSFVHPDSHKTFAMIDSADRAEKPRMRGRIRGPSMCRVANRDK
jgi:hypothetical protein